MGDRGSAKWTRKTVVLAITAAIVLAGSVGAWYWLTPKSEPLPEVRDDGLTFYQAIAQVNSSVLNVSGGPWALFSLIGIAAQEPYSPGVKSFESFNASTAVNGCQAVLNGLTIFNGSIPTFDGTFNSGTAPFWQFGYFSNSTEQVLVATDVLGIARVFSPFPLESNCTDAWGDFGLDPTYWGSQIDSNGTLPANSPIAAQSVWNSVDNGYLSNHQPLVELFTSGPAWLTATQDLPYGRIGVDFVSCGLVDFTGYVGAWPTGFGMAYYSGVNKNGTYPGGEFNASTNCYLGNSPTIPGAITGEYQLNMSNATISSDASTQWVHVSTAVNFATDDGFGEYNDTWGLANWMTNWTVTNASVGVLPIASSACPDWVPTLSGCGSSSSGWYAVLLSANGGWLNSYGALPGGGVGWSVPVNPLVSHQQLVVVLPATWNASGDELNVSSTIPSATVVGSIAL